MKKPQFAAALMAGLLTAALVLGCGAGPDTPKEPEPQKPKITLNYETVKLEQGKELSFTADFEAKDLKKVLIDQKEIDAKNYVTAGKENTQVTLKAEYTKSLGEGKHTISIVSSKGQADTVFYLKKATKSPDTGDRTQVMLWVILLGVSAAAVVGAVVYRKREK